MFDVVAISTLSLLAILVVIHLIVRFTGKTSNDQRRRTRWSIPEKLVYFGFVLAVCVLGATAFVSVLTFDAMHGWWLLVHLAAAAAFVFLVAVMSWTVSFRFAIVNQSDQENANTPARGFSWPAKVIYWIILMLSIVVVGVILLSMFPLFGTDQLLQLIDVHRFSGLALFAAVILHFFLVTGRAR